MTVDQETVTALAALLNDAGPDEPAATVGEVYEQLIDAAFRAFMLDFRKNLDRPMSEREHTLAHLAFASGWMAGIDLGLRLADAALIEDEAACPTSG